MPAGTELFTLTDGCEGDRDGSLDKDGVKGVEKGWAADVDVAEGGPSWVCRSGPRGEVDGGGFSEEERCVGVVERRRVGVRWWGGYDGEERGKQRQRIRNDILKNSEGGLRG